MAYINIDTATLIKYHDSRDIVQLSNDDDTIDATEVTNINEDVVMVAENEAAYTIDNYLRNVYTFLGTGETGTGEPSITPEIESITAHLTYCNLWRRRLITPEITAFREEQIERLRRMVETQEEIRENRLVPGKSSKR